MQLGTALGLSEPLAFSGVDWNAVPASPGVYVIYEQGEVIYGDHCSGQIVNMFAQYLFLARVQFIPTERITHPRDAKAACHRYIVERCACRYRVADGGKQARQLEAALKAELMPTLNRSLLMRSGQPIQLSERTQI